MAFLAAETRASLTAETRRSRLMPFSRSQNSNTAKKSAFIVNLTSPCGEQKSRMIISDFVALAGQQTLRSITDDIGYGQTESRCKSGENHIAEAGVVCQPSHMIGTRWFLWGSVFLVILWVAPAPASDWPQLLGPTRDAVYAGPALAEEWPSTGPLI